MRERLGSRLGFLLLAAGCAVGLGNVWRFPSVAGANGGAVFVLFYLVFLFVLGFPLLVAELAIGRAAQRGIAAALRRLGGTWWGRLGAVVFAGNVLLMLYYTDVAGWLLRYAAAYAADGHPVPFAAATGDVPRSLAGMLAAVVAATAICAAGVKGGVERVSKVMMLSLLALMGVLAVTALSLPGAAKGLAFYLKPDWSVFAAHPGRVMFAAMGQAFFTLSVGVGCMTIFGSYIGRGHSLVKEAAWIVAIDTFVAITAGLVIFPACATYGVEVSSGPGLIFEALPKVFAQMAGGRLWGFAFFLFLSLAALTTVVAVFECLIGGFLDDTARRRGCVACAVGAAVAVGSLPCVLWPAALNLEDFAFSQFWLPLGALAICLFVTRRFGWGWESFRREASVGAGPGVPAWMGFAMRWLIPALIVLVIVGGLVSS